MTRKIFSCIIHSHKAPYATCKPSSYFIFLLMTFIIFHKLSSVLYFTRENLSMLHLISWNCKSFNQLHIFLHDILFWICVIQHSKDGTFSAHVFWLNEHFRKENYLIIMPLIFESATCWIFLYSFSFVRKENLSYKLSRGRKGVSTIEMIYVSRFWIE